MAHCLDIFLSVKKCPRNMFRFTVIFGGAKPGGISSVSLGGGQIK